jgi:hypothetical protein
MKNSACFIVSTVLVMLTGCDNPFFNHAFGELPSDSAIFEEVPIESERFEVYKIDFSSQNTAQLIISDLSGQSIYLVPVNQSPSSASTSGIGKVISWEKAGSIHYVAEDVQNDNRYKNLPDTGNGNTYFEAGDVPAIRYDHPAASEFNSNPPPISAAIRQGGRYNNMRAASLVGDTRQVWVENASGAWQEIPVSLQAVSKYCNIWVAGANFDDSSTLTNDNKLTISQVKTLAAKFDIIYNYTTTIFGYEYGGGVNASVPIYGGVDGDPKIQILLYDIGYDYKSSQSSGIVGYFWAKDFYTQEYLSSLGSLKTNKAEIFYVDAHFVDKYPDTAYSTLIHEFQHMINFNEKTIKNGKNYSAWYTEMLSMLAEDMISPLIGIPADNSGHPIARIPAFLGGYVYLSPTEWGGITLSYANTYAFGAYLARNFGGAALVKAIAGNNLIDTDSVSAGLTAVNSEMDFTKALGKYPEAFFCIDPSKGASFNNTVTKIIGDNVYTFTGFNIWDIYRYDVKIDVYYIYTTYSRQNKGPVIYDLSANSILSTVRGHSLILQSCSEWQQVNGDMTINLQKPTDPSVDMYIIVR